MVYIIVIIISCIMNVNIIIAIKYPVIFNMVELLSVLCIIITNIIVIIKIGYIIIMFIFI